MIPVLFPSGLQMAKGKKRKEKKRNHNWDKRSFDPRRACFGRRWGSVLSLMFPFAKIQWRFEKLARKGDISYCHRGSAFSRHVWCCFGFGGRLCFLSQSCVPLKMTKAWSSWGEGLKPLDVREEIQRIFFISGVDDNYMRHPVRSTGFSSHPLFYWHCKTKVISQVNINLPRHGLYQDFLISLGFLFLMSENDGLPRGSVIPWQCQQEYSFSNIFFLPSISK